MFLWSTKKGWAHMRPPLFGGANNNNSNTVYFVKGKLGFVVNLKSVENLQTKR